MSTTRAEGAAAVASPAEKFAKATGGTVRRGNTGQEIAYPDGSYCYVNLLGKLRLHRHGEITVELGTWSDGDALVKAYERAVAS